MAKVICEWDEIEANYNWSKTNHATEINMDKL